jgi:DNA adenine methylase
MRYAGGKNGNGVYQRIISMMPPHDTYIEAFLGSGAILRRKLPAAKSFAYELDQKTIRDVAWHLPAEIFTPCDLNAEWECPGPLPYNGNTSLLWNRTGDKWNTILEIFNADAFEALRNKYQASSLFWGWNDPARTLIYCDPPYPEDVRSCKKPIYEFELMAAAEHSELLDLILAIPCRVMISGYANELYDRKLKGWRRETIPTVNRGGQSVTEVVWCNFPQPFELHDYRYLGNDFHDRDRIKKKARRWIANLKAMPANERYLVFEGLKDLRAELAAAEDLENAAMQKRMNKKAAKAEATIATPKPTMTAAAEVDLF